MPPALQVVQLRGQHPRQEQPSDLEPLPAAGTPSSSSAHHDEGPQNAPVLVLSPETFDQIIKTSAGFVLVDFFTDWCGPCKLMHKELDKLTKAFPQGVTFCKFNCGLKEHEAFSTKQRIKSLPTFRLFKGGRMVDQVTGAKPIELRQLLVYYVR